MPHFPARSFAVPRERVSPNQFGASFWVKVTCNHQRILSQIYLNIIIRCKYLSCSAPRQQRTRRAHPCYGNTNGPRHSLTPTPYAAFDQSFRTHY